MYDEIFMEGYYDALCDTIEEEYYDNIYMKGYYDAITLCEGEIWNKHKKKIMGALALGGAVGATAAGMKIHGDNKKVKAVDKGLREKGLKYNGNSYFKKDGKIYTKGKDGKLIVFKKEGTDIDLSRKLKLDFYKQNKDILK